MWTAIRMRGQARGGSGVWMEGSSVRSLRGGSAVAGRAASGQTSAPGGTQLKSSAQTTAVSYTGESFLAGTGGVTYFRSASGKPIPYD